MIRVSILGATGYSGGELLRLLASRPGIQLQHLTSESSPGQPLSAVHPQLRGVFPHRFEKLNMKAVASDSDVIFSCYPAAVGIQPSAYFVKAGLNVIDLSADFRLPTAALYKEWYKETHTASALLKQAVYGLPELFRLKIAGASLVANPGCYATAAILSGAPLLKSRLIDPKSIIIDAKSGVSGAGKKISSMYMYSEVDENLQPYSVAKHRHQPEIEHALKMFSGVQPTLTFTPHLVPMNRGILSVFYASLKKSVTTDDIRSLYMEMYQHEPFIRILPEGEYPQTKNVTYTNYCDIGITQDRRTRRVIVMAVIDNLVKGAAGQAIQNMNIMLNRSETEGLL